MQFWTNPKTHTAALTLIQELYDRAKFRPPEEPAQVALGRVRQASWSSPGADFDLIKHELAALATVPLGPHLMMLAFCFLDGDVETPQRPASVEEFDAAMTRALAYKKTIDDQRAVAWQIVLPVLLPSKTAVPLPRRFCIEGVRMRLVATTALAEPLRTKLSTKRELIGVVPSSDTFDPPTAVMLVPARGTDFSRAWQTVASSFHLLRSSVDFCLSYGHWRMASRQTPRSMWPHPQWLAGYDGNSTFRGVHFEVEHRQGKVVDEISRQTAMSILTMLRLFRTKHDAKDIRRLIGDCMRLYGDAVDSRHDHWAFLGFWQVLERVALVDDKGGVTQEVARRVAWFVGTLGLPTGFEHTLLALGKKRNELTHAGRGEAISEDDVNVIKLVAEHAIMRLVRARKVYASIPILRAAFEHRSTNNTDLDALVTAVRALQDERQRPA